MFYRNLTFRNVPYTPRLSRGNAFSIELVWRSSTRLTTGLPIIENIREAVVCQMKSTAGIKSKPVGSAKPSGAQITALKRRLRRRALVSSGAFPETTKAERRHARLRVAPAIGRCVFVRLESENESGRRLSRIGCCVGTQGDQAEVGTLVNEASVFEAKREVAGEAEVSAAPILEHCFRLVTRSRDESKSVLGGNESQCTGSRQYIRTESPTRRNSDHGRSGGLVDIGLNRQGYG